MILNIPQVWLAKGANMSNIYDDDTFFKAYSNMSRSKGGLTAAGEWHQLQRLFPNLKNKRVLDLGCGYGWHCKYAIETGADSVLGIDGSSKMIETAKRINQDGQIEYRVCNIEEYDYPNNQFDLVISNLVLHYIANLKEVYQNVYKTLKTGGLFLFNIEHPCFTAGINEDWIYDSNGKALYWAIDNYFYSGERKTNFLDKEVIKQHHTLTQILNSLLQCGFEIKAIEEAMPPENMRELPEMENEMRRPMMLLIKAQKTAGV